jgi:6-phosphogluconolactonase/glucosamine-6-phosphate isomerase/deaminase
MEFLRDKPEAAERAIATTICEGLFEGKRVLWLTSGGSNIAIEKRVMDLVRTHASEHLASLAILPIDERYGPSGHADSNATQLQKAGFDPGAAMWVDVLMHNLPFDQTVTFYTELVSTALASAGLIVGQFGIGSDGHVAGIKPDSPATEPDESTIAGYEWSDYTRMTLMPAALKQINVGFLIAYGEDKGLPLKKLQEHKTSFNKLPAMLLHEIPEVYVYNGHIESEG